MSHSAKTSALMLGRAGPVYVQCCLDSFRKMGNFVPLSTLKKTESDNWLHYTPRILPLRWDYWLTTLLTVSLNAT